MLAKLSKGTILSTGKNSLYKSTGWSHYSLLLETECTLEEKNRGNNIPVQSKTRLKCKFFLDILKQLKEKQKQRASTAPEVAAFGRWHKRRKILQGEGNSRTTARSEHSRLRSTTTTYFRKPRKPKRICILYGKIAQIQSKKASKEEGEEREDVRPQRKISGNHRKSDYLPKKKEKSHLCYLLTNKSSKKGKIGIERRETTSHVNDPRLTRLLPKRTQKNPTLTAFLQTNRLKRRQPNRKKREKQAREGPLLASSEEEKAVEVMRRETNWPNTKPIRALLVHTFFHFSRIERRRDSESTIGIPPDSSKPPSSRSIALALPPCLYKNRIFTTLLVIYRRLHTTARRGRRWSAEGDDCFVEDRTVVMGDC